MDIRQARGNEYENVISFYYEMIDKMQASEFHPTWKMGVYPTDDYLEELVLNQQVFICIEDGKIIGASVINHNCNVSYAKTKWEVAASENEVMIIHLLCILPEYGGRGFGTQLMRFLQEYAADNSQKAIRLDVMEENLPAIKLYESAGFKRIETLCMFYESTGWSNFIMYEYKI